MLLKFKVQQPSCRQAVFIPQLDFLFCQPISDVSIIGAEYLAGFSETWCTGRRNIFVVLMLGIHIYMELKAHRIP